VAFVQDHVDPTKDGPGKTRRLIKMKFKKEYSIFQVIHLYRKLFLRSSFDAQHLIQELSAGYAKRNLKFFHELDEVRISIKLS
jgi:hypothetical protein